MVQRFGSTAGVSRLAYALMNSTFRELPSHCEKAAGQQRC